MTNSSAQYPTITVVSRYGSTQTDSGEVFVPASAESYTHDSDGNLTADGRWTYTWDGENRLIGIKAPEHYILKRYLGFNAIAREKEKGVKKREKGVKKREKGVKKRKKGSRKGKRGQG